MQFGRLANTSLSTLFLHQNNLIGTLPVEFCDHLDHFQHLHVDCFAIQCDCCNKICVWPTSSTRTVGHDESTHATDAAESSWSDNNHMQQEPVVATGHARLIDDKNDPAKSESLRSSKPQPSNGH